MPSDLTRPYGDPPHYKAVVMQQGRVILDRDFNALQDLIDRRIAADALDEIGPCGTPDDGLAISLPTPGESQSVSASHWRPRPWDFLIKPGVMYVGGQRVVFERPPESLPPLSYFHQPDWANPPDPFGHSTSHSFPQHEFIYLHAYEQEVGAVEDPDLLEVALGGPDTSQRVRLMRRIVRLSVAGTDCATALADANTDWGNWGYRFDSATMRLLPEVRLQVGFTSTLSTSNPCDPVAQGGYLGAENQLIRVMIHDPGKGGSSASLLWGYDNASFLYRVTVDTTGTVLQLSQPPVDVFHNPSPNQVVEVLRTAMVLGTEPDQTDPTGQRTIVRCIAEATGFVATVVSYTSSDNSLVLEPALPTTFTSDPNPLFLRVWVGRQSFDLSSTAPIVLTDPTPNASSPGLQVTITQPTSTAKGATLPAGAFWLFAVRPSTPQALYPERFLNAPQPPDGPRQWVCPLAVIDWAQRDFVSVSTQEGVVHDCRVCFDNLVTLTNRRLGGCCTVTVWPSDAPRLQSLIDRAVGKGKVVTVCLTPGIYSLPRSLRLTGRHAQLVLEACSGGATLQAAAAADTTLFLDGLVVLVGAHSVKLRNLQLDVPSVQLTASGPLGTVLGPVIAAISDLQSMIGIRLAGSRGVRIEGCHLAFSPLARTETFGMGIFAQGDCRGLIVRGCRFESATPPTVTPVSAPSPDTTPTATALATALPPSHSAPPIPFSASIPIGTASFTRRMRQLATTPLARAAGVPQNFVALYGFVALEFLPDNAGTTDATLDSETAGTLDAILDGALDGNEFHNLTFAALVAADIGVFRVQGNRVTQCAGGFWLEPSDFRLPEEDNIDQASFLSYYDALIGFWEVLIPSFSWGAFPWPAGDGAGPTTNVESLGQLALSITDNRIEAILASSTLPGAALVLLLSQEIREGSTTSASLILASNELRGLSASIPVVLLAINGGNSDRSNGPTALTGNLVINRGLHPSLILYALERTETGIGGLAITGNVLIGLTTVSQLMAMEAAELDPAMTDRRGGIP